MKKRRTIIISLLLIATIALGIGYAAMSGDVTVNGKVKNKPHELHLVFVNDAENPNDAKVTDSRVGTVDNVGSASTAHTLDVQDGADYATFNISDLAHKDDYITARVTVKNTNQYDVVVDDDTAASYVWVKGAEEFFTVEGTIVDKTPESALTVEDRTLGYNDTLELDITITMVAEATGDDLEADFTLTISAMSKTDDNQLQ